MLFSINDVFLFPLCVIILYAIIRGMARKEKKEIQKFYFYAFWYKVFFVLAYTIVIEFYYKGGDTVLYFQSVTNLRTALNNDFNYILNIINSLKLDTENPLSPYFLYDEYGSYYYMHSVSNFFVPRLALIPSIIFFNSYLCISMVFGFFALVGSIRLFKTFYHYYPAMRNEIALAGLFLPSIAFWTSALLKDTISYGAIGFIIYGVFNLFIKKTKILSSLIWIIIAGLLLYYTKVYILLVLVFCIIIWMFAETNKFIADRTFRTIFSFLTFVVAGLIGYALVNYFTSLEAAQVYRLDNLLAKAEYQRQQFANIGATHDDSHFAINTSTPAALVFNGITATFFRPFFWEIHAPIALFSSAEAFIYLYLTVNLFIRKGVKRFFVNVFSDPRILMCFVFAIIFAIAVGASTTNFGALSRYKIPAMPFYLLMILFLYKKSNLSYPKWFAWILRYQQNQINYVRH